MKKKTKIILIILFIIILIAIGVGILVIYNNGKEKNKDNSIETSSGETNKVIDLEQNNIAGKYSEVNIIDSETAKQSIEEVKDKIGIESVDEELKSTKVNTTGEYINTYRFKQMYKGIEVYSGELIVYTDKQGNAEGIINKYYEIPTDFNINPVNSDQDLEEIVLNEVDNENSEIQESKLIIYYLGNEEYILAHEYTVKENEKLTHIIIADATKEIIDNTVEVSTGNPLTISQKELEGFQLSPFDPSTYTLIDNDRHFKVKFQTDHSIEAYMWSIDDITKNSDNVTINREDADLKLGYDTLNTVQDVYDYYREKFKLNSVRGNEDCWIDIVTGVTMAGKANYSNNAFWDLNDMIVYGSSNLFNYDVETTSHEYMHGIMQYKIGVKDEKDYERQILEEAYGDIFGMCAESYYSNASNIDGIMNIIDRNIKDSNVTYSDIPESYKEFKKDKKNNKDEHYYSLVISKAAYLMSQKLTLTELENLWFNSIDILAERDCTLLDCYYAVVRMSQILDLSDEKQNAVKEAFESVGFGKIEIYDDEQIEDKDNKETTNEVQENEIEANSVEEQNQTNKNETLDKENNTNNNKNDDNNQTNSESKQLSIQEAVNLLNKEFGDYKDINVDYEYQFSVTYQNQKFYAIYALAEENYMYSGGEWLEKMDDGRFYVGTYYVAANYTDNKVRVGLNHRDLDEYKEGDNVGYFIQSYYLDVN